MRNKESFLFACCVCISMFMHKLCRNTRSQYLRLYISILLSMPPETINLIKLFRSYFLMDLISIRCAVGYRFIKKETAPLEVFVYDTKAKTPWYQQLNKPEMKDVELIVGITNATETKILADAALQKKIPFISATFPNDAGVRKPLLRYLNPHFNRM